MQQALSGVDEYFRKFTNRFSQKTEYYFFKDESLKLIKTGDLA
jgi:hypothetical protein